MNAWYYSDAGAQAGPVSRNELIDLLASGRLNPETLVWRDGLAEWAPANGIPELSPSPYAPPAEVAAEGYDPVATSGSQIRPWVRYWARMLDFVTVSMIIGILLGILYPAALEAQDTLLNVGLLVVYNFIEPVMFAIWGNTPGKALLRIGVRNRDGSKLGYRDAFGRVIKVWIRGEGLGVPLISLFTHISAFNRLKNHGITSWDQEGGFVVSHQKIQAWRILVIVFAFIGLIALITAGLEAGG